MEKVTIYGMGYVGKAVADFLSGKAELYYRDPQFIQQSLHPTDLAIICVPTSQKDDGSCDISIVQSIIMERKHRNYLVKSTVPPGTCNRLMLDSGCQVVFSPEYIGEGGYHVPVGYPHPTDMKQHTFHTFGGNSYAVARWIELWQKAGGWGPRYVRTDAMTAEVAKYAENMFLAMKKVFSSELYLASKVFGVNYTDVRELWLLDTRIGPSHTIVDPQQLHYQGKCLPKDTLAFVHAIRQAGGECRLFEDVIGRNAELELLCSK